MHDEKKDQKASKHSCCGDGSLRFIDCNGCSHKKIGRNKNDGHDWKKPHGVNLFWIEVFCLFPDHKNRGSRESHPNGIKKNGEAKDLIKGICEEEYYNAQHGVNG